MNKFDKISVPGSILLVGELSQTNKCAEEIVKQLNVDIFDLHTVRPEDSLGKSNIISIGQIKQAQRFLSLTPNGKNKVLLIKNAELMKKESSNALLKTLEEPPNYALVILISSNLDLLPTVISRCQVINFHLDQDNDSIFDYKKLLSKPFFEQTKEVEKVLEDQNVATFLNGLEKYTLADAGLNYQSKTSRIKTIFGAKRDIKNNVGARTVLESVLLRYKYNV